MTGVLWLASYPKSGNTWLRAFLANYLADSPAPVDINTLPDFAYGDMRSNYYAQVSGKPANQLSWQEINQLRPRVHQFLAQSRPGRFRQDAFSVDQHLRRADDHARSNFRCDLRGA